MQKTRPGAAISHGHRDGTAEKTVHDARWKSRDGWAASGLLALFLLTRWWWLHDLPGSAFYWEETYRWVAMQEIASGPVRPLLDYQADHYQGGSLVTILLAVVLSPLTGTGLATLKVGALVFSSLSLLSLFALVRSFFGWTAGMIAGLLYVAGPPLVAFWGVCLIGSHSEAVLASLWLVYVTLSLASGRWRGAPAYLLAGVLAALGIWFTPTAAIGVAACGLTWLLLRGLPGLRPFALLVAGFLVGCAPWLIYNASHDWAGLTRVVEVFGARSSSDALRSQNLWQRAADLALVVPSVGLLDPAGVLAGSAWRPVVFAGAGASAALGLLAGARRIGQVLPSLRRPGLLPDPARLEIVFWLYPVIFAAIYLASRFTLEFDPRPVGFRLMVSSAVFAMPPLAISAARGLEASGARRLLAAIGTAVLLLSLGSATATLAAFYVANGTPLRRLQGYQVQGRLAERKHPGSVLDAVREIHPIRRADDRDFALQGLGWGMLESYEQNGTPEELQAALARLPESELDQVRTGLLWAAHARLDQVRNAAERFDDASLRRSRQRLEAILDVVTAAASPPRTEPDPR